MNQTGCVEGAGPVTAVEPSPCPRADRKWVLVAAILASALAFIDGSIVSIAIPAIRAGLGADFGQVQWIMNGYVLFLAALILPGGALGDRFGQRDVFALGIGLFIATSMWCGLARSPEELILARCAKGVAAALMVPGSLSIIAINYPKTERGKAIGLWSAASGLTTALGPLVGGAILSVGGEAAWRWLFFINVPLGVAALFLVLRRIPKSPARPGEPVDWQGGLIAVAALGLIAYGLTQWSEGGPAFVIVGLIAAGMALLAGFVLFEGRKAHPMMPPSLFADAGFTGANLLTLFLYLALGGILFYAPMTLIEARGVDEAQVGAMFIPMTLIMAGLARWAGGLADRFGPRLPLTLGPVVAGVAFLALAVAVPAGGFWSAVVPAMALLGAGLGIAVPTLSTAVMTAVPDERAGAASGVNNAVSRVSQLFAIGGLGALAAAAYGAAIPEAAADSLSGTGFGERLAGATPQVEAARQAAIGVGFRAVALVGAVLAVLSAGIAWVTLRPGRPAPP